MIHLKVKMVDCEYDEEHGVAIVTLQHQNKLYVGAAKVHPDDKDVASEMAGCTIAELRARQLIYKDRIYVKRIERDSLMRLKEDLFVNVLDKMNTEVLHRINIAINNADKEIGEYYDEIRFIDNWIPAYVEKRKNIKARKDYMKMSK